MSETALLPQNDLQQFIVDEVFRQSGTDAIHQLVAKKIQEAIASAIDTSFRSYGHMGKQIEAAVNNAMNLSGDMDIPSYGTMVLALLRQRLDAYVHELVSARLDAEMTEILSIAPKELKLSDLAAAVVQSASEDGDRYGTHITCIVERHERHADWFNIYIDKDEDTAKKDCSIKIETIGQGTIYRVQIDGKDPKSVVRMGGMWGHEKMIFGAYCCGSKFIIDHEDPSTGIGDF